MSDPVRAALIALCGGVAVALLNSAYSVGGRGALLRRTLKQEFELLALIDDGPMREELTSVVDARVALYLARLTPEPKSVQRRRLRWAWYALWSAVLSLARVGCAS